MVYGGVELYGHGRSSEYTDPKSMVKIDMYT